MYKIDEIKMLRLGQRDENLSRSLAFDCSDWLEQYPEASIHILFRRPGESAIVPMSTTLEGTTLTWLIHDYEVGKTGVGNAEFRAVDTAGLRRKSRIIPCSIEETLLGDDETVLYTQDQVDETLAHISEAAQAAQAAKASEEAAALSASEAGESAVSAGTAADVAVSARDAAQAAQTAAETAQHQAEAAQSGVHADAEAAEQAKVAAQAAQASAQGAASQASADRTAAESARADAEAAATHAEAIVEGIDQAGADQVAAVNAAGQAQVTAVNQAGTTQVGNVNAAGTTQVNAVQAKGTQVINSIPADYSALTNEVTGLKSAKNVLETNIDVLDDSLISKQATSAEIIDGKLLDKNGNENSATDWCCTDFINIQHIPNGTKIKISTVLYGIGGIVFYESDKTTIESYINGTNASGYGYASSKNMQEIVIVKTADIAYFRANALKQSGGGSYSSPSDFNYQYAITEKRIIDLEEYVNTSDILQKAVSSQIAYINADGDVTVSSSWKLYKFNVSDIKSIAKLISYTNNKNFYSIAVYSSTPSSSTLVDGLKFEYTGKNTIYNFDLSSYPDNYIVLVATRTATSTEFLINGVMDDNLTTLYDRVNVIQDKVNSNKYISNLKSVYPSILCSNDFTIVGDEIWCPEIDYQNDTTIIHRYKIANGSMVLQSNITTDFGHCNTLDYDPVNDCLIFGNGGNDTSTTGNWFAVVPHPLELGTTASLANDAIVYSVDIGYKVQAVWGDENCGNHNIAIVFANNATTILTVLLKKTDGDFNGQMTILTTQTTQNEIGVQGADYYNGVLYIGNGNYSISCVDMTDYSVKAITKKFYLDDGTAYTGSMQGVYIDNETIWWYFNITNKTGTVNTLLEYWR